MIGAHKLTEHDAETIRELFLNGNNKSKIAREFISSKGEKISREHVSRIINRKRWNPNTRSFLMKDEILKSNSVKTQIEDKTYQTKLSVLRIEDMVLFGVAHYINSDLVTLDGRFFDNCPNDKKFFNLHQEWVQTYL